MDKLARLHLALVHLPIAMTLATLVADAMWGVTKRKFFGDAGLFCILGAALTAPLAVLTGDWLMESLFNGQEPPTAEMHETWAYIALAGVIAAAAVRLLLRFRCRKWGLAVYVVLLSAAVAAVLATGHLGGQIFHIELK